jgi:hypothetical protein
MEVGWTPERKQLLRLLTELNVEPAELYAKAIDELAQKPLTRARLMVAAHCMRELCRCLVEVQQFARPVRANVDALAKQLADAWLAANMSFEPDPEGAVEPGARTVTNEIFVRAQATAAEANQGSKNARRATALATTGQDLDLTAGPIARVHHAVMKFTRWSHYQQYTGYESGLPPIAAVEPELRVIEEALLTRHANRADRVRDVRTALAKANTREEDAE